MKYIDYVKQVIKAIAYDNVILFPMEKVVNKEIEQLEKEVKPVKIKNKDNHEDETTI
tara:strand:+ start:816 stop:986 length:171 start_codon:yes stop_codon:yes gene_type:complete